jgi:hypothetical protein
MNSSKPYFHKDYYPGGSLMPGRSFNANSYRYGGAGGQEKDDEIAGVANTYTAEYWMYDARLGRRWNVDPVTYPWQSSYAAFNNNPVFFVDPLGLEGVKPPKLEKGQRDGDGIKINRRRTKYTTSDGKKYKWNKETASYDLKVSNRVLKKVHNFFTELDNALDNHVSGKEWIGIDFNDGNASSDNPVTFQAKEIKHLIALSEEATNIFLEIASKVITEKPDQYDNFEEILDIVGQLEELGVDLKGSGLLYLDVTTADEIVTITQKNSKILMHSKKVFNGAESSYRRESYNQSWEVNKYLLNDDTITEVENFKVDTIPWE